MPNLVDAVAWSILWTEGDPARRHVRRRHRAGTSGDSASAATQLDLLASPDDARHEPEDADWAQVTPVLRARAERILERAAAAGITPVPRGDGSYPVALAPIPNPPPVLWVKGDLVPAERAVAIVGSRSATPHALEVAHRLGEGLAHFGITVISGLARGVDGAAHRGALDGEGRTVAVLGSGTDVVYPPEHEDLAWRVAASGALVSELIPGTAPVGWHFPRRNRIIAGMAGGVVVVEASEHSGSLITADCMLDLGRPVMAVPGGVLSGRNRGAHALLRQGARLVEAVDDVLDEIHFVGAAGLLGDGPADGDRPAGGREPPADPLLRAMKVGEPYDVPFLSRLMGLDAVRVLARLAELELGGWIRRAGGGRFVRSARTC